MITSALVLLIKANKAFIQNYHNLGDLVTVQIEFIFIYSKMIALVSGKDGAETIGNRTYRPMSESSGESRATGQGKNIN